MREIFANIMTKNDVTRNDNKITLFYKPTNIVQGPDILLMILDMGRVNTKINKRKSIVSVHPTTYIITM